MKIEFRLISQLFEIPLNFKFKFIFATYFIKDEDYTSTQALPEMNENKLKQLNIRFVAVLEINFNLGWILQ